VSFVSGVAPDPSALISQIFGVFCEAGASAPVKARSDTNKILVPSGDHAGPLLLAEKAVSLVSAVWAEPSAFITQIFEKPQARSNRSRK
jgi:hypothetical protein